MAHYNAYSDFFMALPKLLFVFLLASPTLVSAAGVLNSVTISPIRPTATETIVVTVQGTFPTGGYTIAQPLPVLFSGNEVVVTVASTSPRGAVIQVLTDFDVTASIGNLKEGNHSITARLTEDGRVVDSRSIAVLIGPPVDNVQRIALVSAASFSSVVAPGAIVSAFGRSLTASTATAAGPAQTIVGGVSVVVRDSGGRQGPAEILFVSPDQINFVLPEWTSLGLYSMNIASGSDPVKSVIGEAYATAPALFSANGTGKGPAAALALRIRDGQLNYVPVFRCDVGGGHCETTPVSREPGDDLYLVVFGTGVRRMKDLRLFEATLGDQSLDISYAGPQGEFAGLDQINARVPPSFSGHGEMDFVLNLAGRKSNSIKINLR